jgi:hypothetical protein
MHDRRKSIPEIVPRHGCDGTCECDASDDGASGESTVVQCAFRKCNRCWKSECNCERDCRKFHGAWCPAVSPLVKIRHNRTRSIKFFFSAMGVAELFTSHRAVQSSLHHGKPAGVNRRGGCHRLAVHVEAPDPDIIMRRLATSERTMTPAMASPR